MCQAFNEYYGKNMSETLNAQRSLVAIKIQLEKHAEAETILRGQLEVLSQGSKQETIKT